MKEQYRFPALEIIAFDTEDVTTTSLTRGADPGNPGNDNANITIP